METDLQTGKAPSKEGNKGKTRDYYFDNLKFILIFLVVLGHYCGSYLESWLMLGIYNFIYSFHMPLFIFISGYFSRNIAYQRIKDINNLLIPYFYIQLYLPGKGGFRAHGL